MLRAALGPSKELLGNHSASIGPPWIEAVLLLRAFWSPSASSWAPCGPAGLHVWIPLPIFIFPSAFRLQLARPWRPTIMKESRLVSFSVPLGPLWMIFFIVFPNHVLDGL